MPDRLTTERLAEIRAELANQLPADNLDKLVLLTRMIRAAYELLAEVDALTRERDELAAWKESAMAVEAEWDEQAVGRALQIPLGAPIRANILAGIEALQQRANQLAASFIELDQYLGILDWDDYITESNVADLLEAGKNREVAAAILAARDAEMKRLGAAEELERILSGPLWPDWRERLRERAAELRSRAADTEKQA